MAKCAECNNYNKDFKGNCSSCFSYDKFEWKRPTLEIDNTIELEKKDEEISELKADITRFKIHLECAERAAKSNGDAFKILETIVKNQKERINYLEGATHHAGGTPLSIALEEIKKCKDLIHNSHEYIRDALGLFTDDPDRFDYYAQLITKLKDENKRLEHELQSENNCKDCTVAKESYQEGMKKMRELAAIRVDAFRPNNLQGNNDLKFEFEKHKLAKRIRNIPLENKE